MSLTIPRKMLLWAKTLLDPLRTERLSIIAHRCPTDHALQYSLLEIFMTVVFWPEFAGLDATIHYP